MEMRKRQKKTVTFVAVVYVEVLEEALEELSTIEGKCRETSGFDVRMEQAACRIGHVFEPSLHHGACHVAHGPSEPFCPTIESTSTIL